MKGVVAKSTGSWYTVWLQDKTIVSCRLRGKFRLQKSSLTNPIAVGDTVEVDIAQREEAVITEIATRENYLLRKATKSSSQFQIVASNIDQAIIIATDVAPRTSTGFIDRFLVTCSLYGIAPIIVYNKDDLVVDRESLDAKVNTYQMAGYRVLTTCFTGKSIDKEITDLLTNKTTLLFGHSGVGKSTLLNRLIPEAGQDVGVISDQHQKGKHTTTFAQMFEDRHGNRIIDTPGVKEFGLEEMETWKLGHCYPEFKVHITKCKYNTCVHQNEPHCAVIAAFVNGHISEFRYENYLNMLDDLQSS
ncbi:MAG: ribosome biogenesis GTPase [Bacteroidia bacterium]|jgi:ribosome biogenesis GTPase